MQFSELLASVTCDANECSVHVGDDWLQGRSVFGGLQAALALKAMRAVIGNDWPLRTLQVTFVAPIPAGTVRVSAQVLRRGKNALHAEARFTDSGATLCTVTAVFGARRESQVVVTPQQSAAELSQPISGRYIPGLAPAFTQHFSMRWRDGNLPFTANTLTRAVIDVDMHDSAQRASEAHVLAIADSIPPVALAWFKQLTMGSSLTWALELLADADTLAALPLTGWRLDADLTAAAGGYTSQSVMVWGAGGVPVALSRQSMVVFG